METQEGAPQPYGPRYLLVECVFNPDGKYALQVKYFKDLKAVVDYENGIRHTSANDTADVDVDPATKVLLIEGYVHRPSIADFLTQTGIERWKASSYCDLVESTCEEHVRAFEDGENSFIAFKWFRTCSYEIELSVLADLRCSEHLPLDNCWRTLWLLGRRSFIPSVIHGNGLRSGARLQALSALQTPKLLIMWLDLFGRIASNITSSQYWEVLTNKVRALPEFTPTTFPSLVKHMLHREVLYGEMDT